MIINFCKSNTTADANVNATDFFGKTALMIASSKNKIDIAKLLIENGADVNMQDENGVNSLMIACDKNNIDIVKLLIQAKANLDIQEEEYKIGNAKFGKNTALHYAVFLKNNDLIKILVDANADITLKDANNKSPFEYKIFDNYYQ